MLSDAVAVVVRCRSCGVEFWVPKPERGPLRNYCSPRCRQAAYVARRRAERATELADLMLASSHQRLVAALQALGPSSVTRLRALLPESLDRNLSQPFDDGLCRGTTTGSRGVVAPLHKEG